MTAARTSPDPNDPTSRTAAPVRHPSVVTMGSAAETARPAGQQSQRDDDDDGDRRNRRVGGIGAAATVIGTADPAADGTGSTSRRSPRTTS